MSLGILVGRLALVASVVAVTGCAGGAEQAGDTAVAAAEAPRVEIVSPAEGDSVSLPFTVRLAAFGVEVVPATGMVEAGKGHHHLVIGDVPVADSLPLPGAPVVIHLGTGGSEHVIESLSPGAHRIIAIFATGDHVPMVGAGRDTVTVIVR